MKIAVEGMDGSGKTTIAKLLAEKLGYTFLDKPLHFIFDTGNDAEYKNLMMVAKNIYRCDDSLLKAWFFGLGNLFSIRNFKDTDLVIDRHFASNYFWNGSEESKIVFKTMIDIIGTPDITILLYASPEVRLKRLYERNPNDYDLTDSEKHVVGYDKMISFLEEFKIPHVVINTEGKSIEQVLEEALMAVAEKQEDNKGKLLEKR